MDELLREYPFRCKPSLKLLVDFWAASATCECPLRSALPQDVRDRLRQFPQIAEPVEDVAELEPYRDLIMSLMSAVVPAAFWDSEALAIAVPFSMKPMAVSPLFEDLFLTADKKYKSRPYVEHDTYIKTRLMRAYFLILSRCYGIHEELDYSIVHVVEDGKTGLERYFRFRPDFRFVEVHNLAGPEHLSDEQRATILDHLTEPEIVRQILRPEDFEFVGFTVLHATDCTASQVMSDLDRDLIDKDSIASHAGFLRLQQRLRTLFGRPDLMAGLAAIQGDRALLLSSGCDMTHSCIFSGSNHVSLSEFEGSIYHRAAEKGGLIRIRDLRELPELTRADQEALDSGIRSMIVAPLYFQGKLIGTLKLCTPNPGDLGPTDELLVSQILPMFSMALKRSLEKLENDVEAIIKQKCTAVHPSVEWRFRKSVLDHLERLYEGKTSSEMDPIIFDQVHPLYGSCDIRGSSEARNKAIKADLSAQLNLAQDVIGLAMEVRPIPVLQELSYRVQGNLERIQSSFGTGDERSLLYFLREDVEPVFEVLTGYGLRVSEAVVAYREAMDPQKGTVYRQRRDFEESVATFNDRISAYLDREEAEAQTIFPHYFDKHQTDGINYVIYMGRSMVENGSFDEVYVRNMRIWQLMVACGIAWHAEQLRSFLKVPLDATHLILVNHSPLAIRFRFDEKRFDVDGAYNTSHEIIRSRIDKAMVSERTERLTQPGKIAIVYSRPEEFREMRRHIDFLQNRGYLTGGLELLDLEDLPDVAGLKALRVEVNLASSAIEDRMNRLFCWENRQQQVAV